MNLCFSVLISVYFKEKAEYLDLALKSITDDQLLKPNEIVLVKDGPLTKELDEIIDKYVKKYNTLFKIISLQKNFGLGKALNIGLHQCTYELVARMDTDDIAKPERFVEQIKIFQKNPKLDIIGSWIDEFREKNGTREIISIRKVPETKENIYNTLKFSCVFNHPTVMYKKQKILDAGSYLSEFVLEDYYLWIRLCCNNANMYNIQKSLVYFRITENFFKRRKGIRLLKDDFAFQKKIYNMKFINKRELIYNISLSIFYRLMPIWLQKIARGIYRRKNESRINIWN